jgi:hypothetical protein
VTLNEIGTYVYRLIVDDGVNALPSSDTVTIQVVSTLPENRAPTATIEAPTEAVVTGQVIMLNGTASSDPDGDRLSFRWRQTDELGGNLSSADTARVFQPLGGLEAPISQWQATTPGTFYFRLIVTDIYGAIATATVSITVVEAGTAGVTVTQGDETLGSTGEQEQVGDPIAPAACGGSLLPLAVLPLLLRLVRRRIC